MNKNEVIDKDQISKSHFMRFIRLRDKGTINMNDAKMGSKLIGVSESIYKAIIYNFEYLENKFIK